MFESRMHLSRKRRQRLAAGLVGLTGLLGLATTAQADTTLTYVGASGQYTVSITSKAVRIDGDGAQWQLYRDNDPAILSVEPEDQTYTRLDRNSAGQIRQQIDALRAQIETRLQQLPEGKRMAARVAMTEDIPALNTGSTVGLDKTGAHDSVAGVSCDIYQIVRDGQPASTLCVASAAALKLSPSGFRSIKSMFALLQDMLKGTGLEGIGLPYQNLTGMPVRFVDSVSGEQRSLVSVSHDKIPAERFDIPSTYVEQRPQAPASS